MHLRASESRHRLQTTSMIRTLEGNGRRGTCRAISGTVHCSRNGETAAPYKLWTAMFVGVQHIDSYLGTQVWC
jgi:hypothetical protein